jgi:UDP-N-acetylmuramoyl-L-alanyl-D-glutamate--2,6-diaminopimelate ligase
MDLTAILNGVPFTYVQHGDRADITAVCHDTRKGIVGGCLFIPLKGPSFDGHGYIADAVKAGAAAVLIQEEQDDYPPGVYVLKTDDTRTAMSLIAANFYGGPAKGLRLTGVTGTKGKTSTTYFIETILEQAGLTTGVIGTVGIRVGHKRVDVPTDTVTTPDPLELHRIFSEMKTLGASDVVLEVSSIALAFDKTAGIEFAVGVFTNVTHDHLDFHGTMENYRDAKALLFNQCRFGVINADDAAADVMLKGTAKNWLTYGIDNDCDLRAEHIEYMPDGSSFDVEIDGVTTHFYLPVRGRFNIYNCLAAIGAALALGLPADVIKKGVAAITGIPGRIQAVPNDIGAHIFVDYAHTPDSLVNIINAVRETTRGRLIILFGCGGDKDKLKRPKMGRIAGELADHSIITSDNPRTEKPEDIIKQIEEGIKETHSPYDIYVSRREAIFAGIKMLVPGDALIIAGKGHENYQIIGNETIHFDDVEVALEALGEIK